MKGLPESPGKQAADERAEERTETPLGMMLKKIGMLLALGIEHLIPIKFKTTLGASRLSESSQVVLAKRTSHRNLHRIPVRWGGQTAHHSRACGRVLASCRGV